MPKQIREATAAPTAAAPGRIQIGFITPGWGSSGYYSPKILENAATDKVWPAGTQVYFDHPTESELFDRPERSVRDLAAVTTEDARWDGTGLVAEAKVIGPYRDLVTDDVFAEAVGMSIRSSAETVQGEAEGRKGTIIARLVEGISVDLVTKAGRGGKILAVLESSRAEESRRIVAEARNVGQWIESRLHLSLTQIGDEMFGDGRITREERIALSGAVGDGLTAFTAALEQSAPQLYDRDLWDEPQPADPAAAESGRTNVPAPAGQPENTPIPNVQEDTMGNIQVDEAQYASVTEAAGRVPTLESERDTERRRADAAEARLAERDRADAARTIIDARATEAGVTFTALETRGLLASLPVTESGDLDEASFTTSVNEAAATKAEETGAGKVRGFGASTGVSESLPSRADRLAELHLTEKGA